MSSKPLRPLKTPVPSAEEMFRRYQVIEAAIRKRREFNIDELEAAIGMYTLGFHYGWKVLHLVHSKRTIRKYEELLGIKITEEFPELGEDAWRSNAYKIIQAVSNFWKTVSGEEKHGIDVDKRSVMR
jgi:hypothetical protein